MSAAQAAMHACRTSRKDFAAKDYILRGVKQKDHHLAKPLAANAPNHLQ
jgi:hypothetical protein